MQQAGEDQSDDLERLLDEVIPPSTGQADPGIAVWHGREVSDRASLPIVSSEQTNALSGPIASTAGSAGTSTRSTRRFGILPVVVALACVAAGVVGGYLYGSQRSAGVAGSAVGDSPTATSVLVSTTGGSGPVAAGEQNTTEQVASDESPVAAPSAGNGESSDLADSPSSLESLESQLELIDLSLVQFSPGTDRLTEAGQAALEEVATILAAHPLIPTEVKVSTFTQSTPGHNHGLSTLQARSIVEALAAADVDPGRLTSTGLGSAVNRPQDGESLLLFEANDSNLAEALAAMDTNVSALGPDGALTAEVSTNLDLVNEAMAEYPTSSLSLVAYAYTDSRDRSHDRSHEILDEAVAYLTAAGVEVGRLSEVGMGQTPIDTDLETRVEIAVGLPAAISVAVSQIDTDAINFEPGTGELTESSFVLLADVATALQIDPTVAVEIAAHTYTEATSEQNHDLSHTQGDAVVDALVDIGIARERFVVTGHGDPPHFARSGGESYITFRALG